MDLLFKCRTSIHIPRDGSLSLGRRKPVLGWDNVLISRNHVQLKIKHDEAVLDLSVTGRNAVVVERQENEGSNWDVVAVIDPGTSSVLPLESISGNHATRFFILGAREDSVVELRPHTAAAAAAPAAADTAASQPPPQQDQRSLDLDTVTSTSMDGSRRGGKRQRTSASPLPAPPPRIAYTASASAPVAGTASPAGATAAATAAATGKSRDASASTPATAAVTATTATAAVAAAEATAPNTVVISDATAAPAAATSVPSRQQLTRQGPRPTAPPHDGAPYDIDSPVHLLRVRGLSPRYNTGCLGVDLRHVVSGPLQLALVSNYMIDMGWLLSCCPDLAKARQFFVVHGEGPDAEPEMRQQAAEAGAAHVRLHRPPLPIMYGTHHSKAFLLAYSTGLRLIIHTANCVYPDCNDKTQGLWVQDFPRKDTVAAAAPVSTFEQDLVAYFRALALPPAMANPLFEAIAMHDFSFARGTLVASVPGYHRGTAAVQSYGHMRLRRLLEQVPLPSCFAAEGSSCGTASSSSAVPPEGLIIQCSSMGSFDQAWLVDEMGASLAACRRQPPPPPPPPRPLAAAPPPRPSGPPGCGPLPLAVVWPTVEEVRNSIEGWNAGRSIPGPSRNVSKPFMGRYYARWGGEAVGRQRAMPHIKTYTRYRGQQLAWFLVTSHNLSKAAWGELQKNGSQLMIRSYELGVLVTPALEAAYRSSPQVGFCCHHNSDGQHRHHQEQQQHQQEQQQQHSPRGRQQQQQPKRHSAASGSTGEGIGGGDGGAACQRLRGPVSFWCLAGAQAAAGSTGAGPSRAAHGGGSACDGGGDTSADVPCFFPVPYSLPPQPYRVGEDKPWVVDVPQPGIDALGLPWGAPYSHYGHTQQQEGG